MQCWTDAPQSLARECRTTAAWYAQRRASKIYVQGSLGRAYVEAIPGWRRACFDAAGGAWPVWAASLKLLPMFSLGPCTWGFLTLAPGTSRGLPRALTATTLACSTADAVSSGLSSARGLPAIALEPEAPCPSVPCAAAGSASFTTACSLMAASRHVCHCGMRSMSPQAHLVRCSFQHTLPLCHLSVGPGGRELCCAHDGLIFHLPPCSPCVVHLAGYLLPNS